IDLPLPAVVFYTRSAFHFHYLWCSADFALHGWLTGSLVQQEIKMNENKGMYGRVICLFVN
ncbi:hypothetical protein NLX67_21995, partial [Domibacillus sp. A3M-37]|uniref:hypothetical protein n=1 Tax=Domibacillus sp. A3M-37 TaxID=2962037 RepID=UPI0020B7354A